MSLAERHGPYAGGDTPSARPPSLRALLAERALEFPGRAAITAPRRAALTYAVWHAIATESERALRHIGICPDDRLAVIVPSNSDLAAAIVAFSGIAILAPLGAAYNQPEFERAFRQLGITGVIVAAGAAHPARAAASRLQLPVVNLHTETDIGNFRFECPGWWAVARAPIDRDVHLIASTSGTTGTPKVVALTESNMMSAAEAFASALTLTGNDRCLHVQPAVHSAAMVTLGASLRAGSSIAYLDSYDPDSLATALCENPTWLSAPPATYRELLARASSRPDAPRAAGLRLIRSGSALLEPELSHRIEAYFGAPVVQCYGLTETPFVSSSPLSPLPQPPGSVGVPRGCEVAFVDGEGGPSDGGESGEIVVRGPNVMRGYVDAADDADAFIAGWFRTGDIGRRDAEGNLYLLGRKKELINRGGERVFPAEIERVLREDRGLADVAVFGTPHPTLGEEVAAAVIVQPDCARTESDVLRFAAGRITGPFAPKRVFIVDAFPRTANGKIQRHELQRIAEHHAAGGTALTERAATLLEADIVELFEEILGVRGLHAHDNFFFRGGDSLRALRLTSGLRSLSGHEFTVQTLFEAPTPAALAQRLTSELPASPSPLICVQSGTDPIPVFFLNGDLDGGGVYVRRLAQAIGHDKTVYSIGPHGTNGTPPLKTIEDMAADYSALIQRTFPAGPYVLGGYCNGGVVAYEIARILAASGKAVGPVVLVASTATNSRFTALRSAVGRVARIVRLTEHRERRLYLRIRARLLALAHLRHAPAAARIAYLRTQATALIRRFRGFGTSTEPAHSEPFERMGGVLSNYFPGPYDGQVYLVWADGDPPLTPNDPSMGWARVASNLQIRRVPGDHFTMVTREYAAIARIMRSELAPLSAGPELDKGTPPR